MVDNGEDAAEYVVLDASRDAAGKYVEAWARRIMLRPEGTTGPSQSGRNEIGE